MANAGSLIYDVEINISELTRSQRDIDARLSGVESSFNRTGGTVSRVAAMIAGALSVKKISDYAEAWTVLNNKLVNSVKVGEDLAQVNERVFKIAQDSRSSIDGVATLYSRLERATRDAGVSGKELAGITTTITKAMAVSGATTAESEGALIQLSQGLASGVLRGQEFNSMAEQAPALMKGLSDSLGVGIGELRAMAAQGELTTKVLLDAFKKMGPTIEKEFGKTVATIGQSLEVANNNITKFVGESATVKSFVSVFNDSVVTLSANLDALSGVLTVAAAVVGSRYVGALAMATAAQVRKAMATRASTVADAAAANQSALVAAAELRSALAAKQRALAELGSAAALRQNATSATAVSAAEAILSSRRLAAATATDNYNRSLAANVVAQNAAGAAARNANAGMGLMRGALGLIGGPVGVAMLAASAILYFTQRAKEARDSANSLADGVNSLVQKFREMSRTEIAASIAKLRQSMSELTDAVKESQAAFNEAAKTASYYQGVVNKYGETTKKGREAAYYLTGALDRQALAADALSQAKNRLSQAQSGVIMGQAELNGGMRTGAELLSRNASEATVAGNAMNYLGKQIDFAARAKGNFNAESLRVDRPKDVQKYLDGQLKSIELNSELNDKKRAQLKAEQDIYALGGSEEAANLARERAGIEFDAAEKRKEARKADKKSATEGASEAKKSISQLQELANQTEVLTLTEQRRYREAAQAEAVFKLGEGATAAQVQEARDAAGQEFDIKQRINDRKAASDTNYYAAANLKRQDDLDQTERMLAAELINFDQAQERKAQIAADYQKKIAEATAAKAVTPQQELKAMVDPVQALANENAQKLALIKQFETAKTITENEGLALRNAANTVYEQQRLAAQEQLFVQQSEMNAFLMSSVNAMGGQMTSIISGMLTGTMTLKEAMSNLANTILDQAVGALVQMGMQYVKNMMIQNSVDAAEKARMAANGAMYSASVAAQVTGMSAMAAQNAFAATAAIPIVGPALAPAAAAAAGTAAAGLGAPAVSTAPLAGARKNGGPVSAGGMYQVGEGGMPEIFKASNGSQYMIPGDNGSVISNKDMNSGGGGGGVQINIINSVAGVEVSQQPSDDERVINIAVKRAVDTVSNQLSNRTGQASKALETGYNVTGKAQ